MVRMPSSMGGQGGAGREDDGGARSHSHADRRERLARGRRRRRSALRPPEGAHYDDRADMSIRRRRRGFHRRRSRTTPTGRRFLFSPATTRRGRVGVLEGKTAGGGEASRRRLGSGYRVMTRSQAWSHAVTSASSRGVLARTAGGSSRVRRSRVQAFSPRQDSLSKAAGHHSGFVTLCGPSVAPGEDHVTAPRSRSKPCACEMSSTGAEALRR